MEEDCEAKKDKSYWLDWPGERGSYSARLADRRRRFVTEANERHVHYTAHNN